MAKTTPFVPIDLPVEPERINPERMCNPGLKPFAFYRENEADAEPRLARANERRRKRKP